MNHPKKKKVSKLHILNTFTCLDAVKKVPHYIQIYCMYTCYVGIILSNVGIIINSNEN